MKSFKTRPAFYIPQVVATFSIGSATTGVVRTGFGWSTFFIPVVDKVLITAIAVFASESPLAAANTLVAGSVGMARVGQAGIVDTIWVANVTIRTGITGVSSIPSFAGTNRNARRVVTQFVLVAAVFLTLNASETIA